MSSEENEEAVDKKKGDKEKRFSWNPTGIAAVIGAIATLIAAIGGIIIPIYRSHVPTDPSPMNTPEASVIPPATTRVSEPSIQNVEADTPAKSTSIPTTISSPNPDNPNVWILDNVDPDSKTPPFDDTLTLLDGTGTIKRGLSVEWASNRDLTSQQFSERFEQYRSQTYLMIDVDVYPSGSDVRYSMVWRKNTDGRGWAEYRNMSSARYGERWEEYKNMGYRPLDIESYRVGNRQRFAGIWVENREGLRWSSQRGMTSSEYGDYFTEQRNRDYRIIDIEVYPTSTGLRYAAIWVQNSENIAWAQLRDMTRETYQTEIDARGRNGYSVVDFESYRSGGRQLYAAIWERRPGYAHQVRTNRTATEFANLWRKYRDEGYRLVDFERYETGSGDRYGGIWIENNR